MKIAPRLTALESALPIVPLPLHQRSQRPAIKLPIMTIEVQRSFAECLTPEEQSAWKEFLKLCDDHGLLLRPGELQPGDTTHGLNDEATLL